MTTLLELDDRRRTSLGKIGRKQDTRYLVEEYDDGTIVLMPVVVLSAREAEVLADPELIAALRAGIEEARAGKVSPLDLELPAHLEAD